MPVILLDSTGPQSRKLRITETDRAVLTKIAQEGFQSYRELRSSTLRQKSRCHTWVILKRLSKARLLVECPGPTGEILGWTLDKKGASIVYDLTGISYPIQKNTYRTQFTFDVTVRRVKNLLMKSSLISNWVPRQALKHQAALQYQYFHAKERAAILKLVPSGSFELIIPSGLLVCSLNVVPKTQPRRITFQKIESQITSQRYNTAFFVTEDRPALDRIWNIFQEVLSTSFKVKFQKAKNGVHFTSLETLMTNALHAPWYGEGETFSLAELNPEDAESKSNIGANKSEDQDSTISA